MRHRVRLALCLAALTAISPLFLTGCEFNRFGSRSPDEATVSADDWVESSAPVTAELEALWDRSKDVVGNQGFAIDEERTKFADRTIATRWNATLSPHRFEGRRQRVWIRFRDAQPGKWFVAVAVQGQRNVDIDRPSEPAGAKWEDVASDADRANVFLYMIESGFRTPEAAEETVPKNVKK